jgi:hypothetical protein
MNNIQNKNYPKIKYLNNNPVFVVDKNGNPMNPYFDKGFVRKVLKSGEAKVYKRDPFFTIQLINYVRKNVQYYLAGIDTGKIVGISVVDPILLKEVLSTEFQTRSHEIRGLLSDKAMYRRNRRNRLRYRKKRFENRKASKGTCKVCGGNLPSSQKSKGKIHEICNSCLSRVNGNHYMYKDIIKPLEYYRIAPSVKHKIETHIKIMDEIESILPIKKWTIEKTKFDTQKAKNPNIKGTEYQQGEMFGFTNIREYVLHRDNHTCQNPKCKNKSKQPILNVHHIIYKSMGGTDKPNNLITLCDKCHTNHISGILYNWMKNRETVQTIKTKTGKKSKSDADMPHMGIVYKHIKQIKKNVEDSYGYITKRTRQLSKIEKTHANDAFMLAIKPLIKNLIIDEEKGFKPNITFNKIKNFIVIEQKRRSKRSLQTITEAKYIEKKTGKIKTGKELSKNDNTRINRQERAKKKGKFIKGMVRNKKDKSTYSKNAIGLVPHPNNKNFKMIRELGGMSGKSVYVYNYNGKEKGTKAASMINLICRRNGFIQKINK